MIDGALSHETCDVDLNLFVVLDAIYTEGNLTRAGEIIGITQPAVSNSLSRLRTLFDDPLFVRTADGMTPTPVAQNIIGSVRQSLELMRSSIQDSEQFNPSESTKRFRISLNDLSQAIWLPHLVQRLQEQAPKAAIECYQVRRRELTMELAAGNLDIALDIPLQPDPQIKQLALRHSPCLRCPLRAPLKSDHPTMEEYLELEHIHISSRRGGLGTMDLALGKLGLNGISLRTQHYLSTPIVIANSDLAMTVPMSFANFASGECRILQLPIDTPDIEPTSTGMKAPIKTRRMFGSDSSLLMHTCLKEYQIDFVGNHILSVDQFERSDIDRIFKVADSMLPYANRERVTRVLEGAILGNMFFEPSTRTRVSLGAPGICSAARFARRPVSKLSAAKGESFYDTARVLSGYSDAIVMRHEIEGSVAELLPREYPW